MKSELASLEELQLLDLATLEIRQELTAIPENLEAMRSDVDRVSEILAREAERLAEAEQWGEQRDREITMQNELLAKSKAKLQVARNEKELKAAQREIDTIRKNIQEREAEALKVMEAIEQYRTAITSHNEEFAELEKQLNESVEEGKAKMAELEGSIGKTESRRSELASQVKPEILRLYERIHKRLGRAVVPAQNGNCMGCNMEIRAQIYNEIQRGDKMFQCVYCRRILIFKPPEESEEADKA